MSQHPREDEKICPICGRVFGWRKKWASCWNEVRFCSDSCRRRRRLRPIDRALEASILALLETRAHDATICPSEAARDVRPDDDTWRSLMDQTRDAARRLVSRGLVEIVQQGRVVDPSTAKGAIRIRRASR